MAEVEIRNKEEILDFITEIITSRRISVSSLEREASISQGGISRWKNGAPKIDNLLKVLGCLDIKWILQTQENSLSCDIKQPAEEESIDVLIRKTMRKALKNCKSLSEKEILYKVLQAFI